MKRRTTSLLAVGAAATALLSPGTASADEGPNGQIAYVDSEFCCETDIWVVNEDGSEPHNITNTEEAMEYDPVWSPDGTRIVYTRYDNEFEFAPDIWVMNADGSDQTNLTNTEDVEDFGADWSPNGLHLVFTRYVEGDEITDQADIFTMDADGSNQVNITHNDSTELDPAWSPDGDRLVFTAGRNVGFYNYMEIVTTDTDGSNEVILTEPGNPGYDDAGASWSPDGDMIVWMAQTNEPCCGDWDVWAMNEDGSGQTNLTPDEEEYGDWFPSWSPDGTEIVFETNRLDGTFFDLVAIPAPTVLPPPGVDASGSIAARYRQITTDGGSNPDWGPEPGVRASLLVTTLGGGRGGVGSESRADGIRCGGDCFQEYTESTTVTLTHRARPGSTFAGWRGACSGRAATCVVTVDGPIEVGAVFKRAR